MLGEKVEDPEGDESRVEDEEVSEGREERRWAEGDDAMDVLEDLVKGDGRCRRRNDLGKRLNNGMNPGELRSTL